MTTFTCPEDLCLKIANPVTRDEAMLQVLAWANGMRVSMKRGDIAMIPHPFTGELQPCEYQPDN